jgi:diguanylate cyclase (GGDEF)-like protein
VTAAGLQRSPPPTGIPEAPTIRPAAGGRPPRMPAACTYAIIGLFLGLGAPAGALAIRILGGASDVSRELRDHEFFYRYQLVGSCAVFGLGGWFVGRRADKYRAGRDRYRDLAEHDALTLLANGRAFLDHYRRALEHAVRYREPLALLLIDLDELKAINDSLGHPFGDAALRHVADVLRECKRDDDMAARWGGDEFALLLRGADDDAARRQADSILARLRAQPLRAMGVERSISVTIGIAATRGEDAGTLFERADLALYAGKAAGRDRAVSDAGRRAET